MSKTTDIDTQFSTSSRAELALNAFQQKSNGWQKKWAYALGAIAVSSVQRTPYGATDLDRQTIKEFLKKTADMITDESNGNRVFIESGKKPRKTLAKKRMQRSISIIYAVCSEKAKRLGAENQKETALMLAAKALKYEFNKNEIGSIIANNPLPRIPKNARMAPTPSDNELDEIVSEHAAFAISNMA